MPVAAQEGHDRKMPLVRGYVSGLLAVKSRVLRDQMSVMQTRNTNKNDVNNKKMKSNILIIIMALLMVCPVSAQTKQAGQEAEPGSGQRAEAMADSLKTIVQQAEKGNAVAQNVVGTWYYKGEHYTRDYVKAARWWSLAARQANPDAIGNLGLLYQYGHGVAADSLKAVKYYLSSISKGNLDLLHQREALAGKGGDRFNSILCAVCYQEGKGVAKDLKKAAGFYELAAKNGSADAYRELAFICQRQKDHDRAKKLFKSAADLGDTTSAYQYAKSILNAKNSTGDEQEAVIYLMKAADGGIPQAQCDLGLLYYQGRFVTRDQANAAKWFTQAAVSGWSPAQWNLALCLIDGSGVERDYDQALYWLGEATAKGYAKQFGSMCADSEKGWKDKPFMTYLTGMSLYFSETKDINGAYAAFKKIRKEAVEARTMMSVCLANKNYKKPNPKKAVSELTRAAGNGNPVAQFYLATLYEAGNGTDKNTDKALELYQTSASGGYAVAQCYMGNLFYEGRIVSQSYMEAVRYYRMAESQGQLTEAAAIRYARCLEEGLGGLEADEIKGKELREKDFRNHVVPMLRKLN